MCFIRLIERASCRFRSFDPRLYQIASLSTLLAYGLLWLHFDVSILQIALTSVSYTHLTLPTKA